MSKNIYLDNAAATKVYPEAAEAVEKALKINYANPSSLHNFALKAENTLKNSRKTAAAYFDADSKEIIFTSGGTESNNLAIFGIVNAYQNRGRHLITSAVEHSSVNQVFKELEKQGWEVDNIKVDKNGQVDLKYLESLIRKDTVLVSIMHVNNELGTVLPVYKIAEIIKKKNRLTFFHVDGVQAAGKIYTKVKNSMIDLYSISGHKLHAPKGTGLLYIKNGVNIKPLFYGGGQQRNLRPGTENIPGIAGLAAALKKMPSLDKKESINKELSNKRDYFIKKLKEIKKIKINSPINGAPHIINFSIDNIKGEIMVHALETENVFLSTGAACSAKNQDSRILKAVGFSQQRSENSLRASLSEFITKADIDFTIKKIEEKIRFLDLN
jgi:cysteine desulfurase